MKLQTTNLYEVRKNKKLMRVLFSLTLRGYSEMRTHLHSIWGEYSKQCPIVLAKYKNKVVGWAIMYRYVDDGRGWYWSAHFYVNRAFRRKGIGTTLYNEAKRLCGDNMYCSAWDKTSAAFFAKNKAKIEEGTWQDTISSNLMDTYLD